MNAFRVHGFRFLTGATLAACVLVGIARTAAPAASSSIPATASEAPAQGSPESPSETVAPSTNTTDNASSTATDSPSAAPADTTSGDTKKPETSSDPADLRSGRESGSRSRRSDRRRNSEESGAATETGAAARVTGTDFSSFRLIPDRNIFNVNRSARSSRPPRESSSRSPQVDSFALVGAMSYSKGDFAFFDGSDSEFRKVLKPGDSIAGFQIKGVGLNSVSLDANGKPTELAIGSHFRREEGGEWQLVAEPAPSSSTSSSRGRESRSYSGERSGSEDSPKTAPTESGGGDANDILQRLMKMREQELNK
ncbi:MAG: hypothetical protein AB7O66_15420 [Limisphaerales bacterium]